MTQLDSYLEGHQRYLVVQHKEWGEILTGFETRNRYAILDAQGEPAFAALEQGGGVWALLTRTFLSSWRPFTIAVATAGGEVLLRLVRPWRWFFARLEVQGPEGQPLGAIQRRWAWVHRRFDLLGVEGQLLGTLEGPLWRPWTFYLRDSTGRELGRVRKRWSGVLKEAFTDADHFGVELTSPEVELCLRRLALGAVFLVDFLFFERSSR